MVIVNHASFHVNIIVPYIYKAGTGSILCGLIDKLTIIIIIMKAGKLWNAYMCIIIIYTFDHA